MKIRIESEWTETLSAIAKTLKRLEQQPVKVVREPSPEPKKPAAKKESSYRSPYETRGGLIAEYEESVEIHRILSRLIHDMVPIPILKRVYDKYRVKMRQRGYDF